MDSKVIQTLVISGLIVGVYSDFLTYYKAKIAPIP